MKLNRLRLLIAVGLALMTCGAQAQAGLYFNPIVTHVSDSQPDTGVFAFLGQGVKSRQFGGLSMGGYYMLSHGQKVDMGLDVRDELEHGNSALLNSFLLGGRVVRKGEHWKPYAELLGGVGTTRSPLSTARVSKAMFKVYGGLDYAFAKHVDFRVVEVGYGTVSPISSATYGATVNYPSVQLLSFSAGLVFRIP